MQTAKSPSKIRLLAKIVVGLIGGISLAIVGFLYFRSMSLNAEQINTNVTALLNRQEFEEARKYLAEIQPGVDSSNRADLKAELKLQWGLVDFEPMNLNKKFTDPYKALLFLRTCREQVAQAKRLLIDSDPRDQNTARQRLRIEAAFLKLNRFESIYLQEGRKIEVNSQISRSISAPKPRLFNFHPDKNGRAPAKKVEAKR
jgi:hypothetical protein